jgi:hypothetical protein
MSTESAASTVVSEPGYAEKFKQLASQGSQWFNDLKRKHPGVRYVGGGAVVGGGLAGALALLHEFQLDKYRKETAKKLKDSDENTLVITIPNKKVAEVLGLSTEPTELEKTETTSRTNSLVPVKTYRNGNYGTVDMKVAGGDNDVEAGAWTLPIKTMLIAGGGIGGYSLIDSLYRKALKKRLEKEEENAKNEYLNVVMGKSAQSNPIVDNVIGIPLLLSLAGLGGSAYLTKRVLDAHEKELNEDSVEPPKVERIVFRSAPVKGEKKADAELSEIVQAAVILEMDKMASAGVMEDPRVQAHAAEFTKIAQASSDIDTILQGIKANPEMRKSIINVGLEKFPHLRSFGWGDRKFTIPKDFASKVMNTPVVGDWILQHGLKRFAGSDAAGTGHIDFKPIVMNTLSKIGPYLSSAYQRAKGFIGKVPQFADKAEDHIKRIFKTGDSKYASLLTPVLTSYIGSTLAEDRKEEPKRPDPMSGNDARALIRNIELDAEGELAEDYLVANRKKIKRLLVELAKQDKLQ